MSGYIYNSLVEICAYLDISTSITKTISIFKNAELKGELRIIDICKNVNCSIYANLPGGKVLYDESTFIKNGIKLNFVEISTVVYNQRNESFIPNLSIIDYLMFNNPKLFKSQCENN